MNPVNELIQISHYAGIREDLVQAGGGNSSIKLEDGTMLLKASGYRLNEINRNTGYAVVNPGIIVDFFLSHNIAQVGREFEKEIIEKAHIDGPKPSIEIFLHAITGRCTLHTHPLLVNVLTSRINGMDELQRLFPDAMFIDYATPGIELAKKYFSCYKARLENKQNISDVIFLKNHGLLVSGEDSDDIIKKTDNVINQLAFYLGFEQEKYNNVSALYRAVDSLGSYGNKVVYLSHNKNIYDFLEKNDYKQWDFSFAPDCVVYCGRSMLHLTNNYINELKQYEKNYGLPSVVIFHNAVYLIADSFKKAYEIESVLGFSAQVASMNNMNGMDMLSEKEIDFLLNWESEKYRKNLHQGE